MSGSAYSVSASLNIRGNYQTVMRQLGRSLLLVDRQIKVTEGNVQRLAGLLGSLGTSGQGALRAAAAMGGLRSAVAGAAGATQGATRSINAQTAALQRNAAAALRSAVAAQQAATAMQRLGTVPAPARAGRAGAAGGGVPASGLMAPPSRYEAYRAARGTVRGGMALLEAGGAEQQATTMLRARGLTPEERAQIQGAVPGLVRDVPGVTSVEAINAVTEARNAVGDVGSAVGLAPGLLRAGRLSSTVTGRPLADALRPLTRALAIRGSFTDEAGNISVAQGRQDLEELENAIIAFGEGVDPREWENFFKQSGTAGRRMSMRSVVGPMGSLIQEVGGQRAGTMATAFNDQIVSGVISDERRDMFRGLGLAPVGAAELRAARAKEEATLRRLVAEGRLTEGEAASARERGAIAPQAGRMRVLGRGLATVRPDLWTQEVFAPEARRKGATTEDALVDMLDTLMQRATGRRFGMSMLQTREVQNDIASVDRVRSMRERGEDPTGIVLREGYTNSLANVTSGFNNLLTALGNAPSVVGLLNDTAQGFNDLAATVRANPSFMEGVMVEARRFLGETRQLATDLADIVSTIANAVRFLRGEIGIGGLIYRGMDDQGRRGADAAARAPGAISDWVRGLSGRILGRSRPVDGSVLGPDGTGTNSDVAPVPPSWGGPMPGAGRGGIQLNNFNPLPPSRSEGVVHAHLHFNGREVADVVVRHMGRDANRPVQGPDRYDFRRGVPDGGTVPA